MYIFLFLPFYALIASTYNTAIKLAKHEPVPLGNVTAVEAIHI